MKRAQEAEEKLAASEERLTQLTGLVRRASEIEQTQSEAVVKAERAQRRAEARLAEKEIAELAKVEEEYSGIERQLKEERKERERLEEANGDMKRRLEQTMAEGVKMKSGFDDMVSAQGSERAEAGALARQVAVLTDEKNRLVADAELLELRLKDLLQDGG